MTRGCPLATAAAAVCTVKVRYGEDMAKTVKIGRYLFGLESGNVRTRRKSAMKLGCKGYVEAVNGLCLALNDSDRHVRGDAAKALGIIGDVSAAGALVIMVERETSVGAVRRAVRSLGQLADPVAVEPLIRIAVQARADLETTAREALDEIGLSAIAELCRSLCWVVSPIHQEAASGIGRISRRFRPAFGAFPGGPVVEAIMTAEDILPYQRLSAIEATLATRLLSRSPERIRADAAKLCERLATRVGDDAIRTSAEQTLNFLSLGRPSHEGEQPEILLRASAGHTRHDDVEMLVRSHNCPMSTVPSKLDAPTMNTWRNLIRALRRRWFAD